MPYIGKTTDGFGVRNRFVYLASADDTSVSGADANGATLTFTDGAYVDVYLNGVLLKAGTDYNTNTANTIAGLSALSANDEVTVIVYDVFTVGDMVSATSGGTFSGAVTLSGGVTGDLDLNTDSAAIKFGADDDVTVTHDPDDGLILKSTATGDDNPFLLTLQTGETDLAANDVIGKIAFQAPDEGTGTDAILVSGAIQARAEGDHSASSNATSLDFMTGASEAATTKMTLTSGGHLGIASGGITIDTVGQALGVGTNNPGHAIEVKHTAPEIMLEETSSGGSKRISMGVKSDGTPFLAAEQSGGIIDIELSGNHIGRFYSNGLIVQNQTTSGIIQLKANVSSGSGTPQMELYRSGTLYGGLESGVNSTASGLGDHMVIKAQQGEVYAVDSGGNSSLLSPHNFDYIPDGASESGAWCFKSNKLEKEILEQDETKKVIKEKVKSGTFISADMTKVIRQVEKLTGEKLIYKGTLDVTEDGNINKHIDDGSTVTENVIEALTKRIEALESK